MRGRAGLAVLALAVASCGAPGSSGATPEPGDSPSATEAATPGSYQSIREMQSDVQAAFILCNVPLKIYDPPTVEGALEQADCTSSVSMLIFEPGDVQAQVGALQAAAEGGLVLVAGDNWIVTCGTNEVDCGRVQGVAGGELIVTP